MRFCNLGSGSSGNATLVEASDGVRTTRLLVDCGFPLRELTARLARLALAPSDIDAVFVTHEHADHLGSARALARRHALPLWTSAGTARHLRRSVAPGLVHVARHGTPITVGALELRPFAVPHDAAEPLQLTVSDGASRLGIVTDLGHAPASVIEAVIRCGALLIECNHDSEMLANGPYPAFLKRRIAGPHGHLANAQAAQMLAQCAHAALRHVVAAHLSRYNNRPALAAAAIAAALGASASDVVVADPLRGTPWLDV